MRKAVSLQVRKGAHRLHSFTLVELLMVMAIIAILAGLTLAAGSALLNKAKRSRATSEIQAMSTALEGYKTDNGIYPPSDGVLVTNTYVSLYPGGYPTNSTLLYIALSGQNYYGATPAPGVKSYMSFKPGQAANLAGPYSYIQDPWAISYGYSTTNSGTATPYNGTGFFDLWSGAGLTAAQLSSTPTLTNAWLSNWQ